MFEYLTDQAAGIDDVLVSVLVPVGIVDVLEIVEIEHHKAEFRQSARHILVERKNGAVVCGLVLHVCEGIGEGYVVHILHKLAQTADRDLEGAAEDADLVVAGAGEFHIQIAEGDLFCCLCEQLQRARNAVGDRNNHHNGCRTEKHCHHDDHAEQRHHGSLDFAVDRA